MASFARPTMCCRQICNALPAKRYASQKALKASIASVTVSSGFPRSLQAQKRPVKSRDIRPTTPSLINVAAFHATSKNQILPPLPQRIQGSANDAAVVPDASPTHGSYHWTFERLISVALVPLTIAPFAAGSLNPVTDAILCAALVVHSHIGFEGCIIDYFPKRRVRKTRIFFDWLLRGSTLLVAVGLYEFETNDVGLTEAIKRVWVA